VQALTEGCTTLPPIRTGFIRSDKTAKSCGRQARQVCMDEFEKLIWLIAEEFVMAFESLETLLAALPEEELTPLVMAAKA